MYYPKVTKRLSHNDFVYDNMNKFKKQDRSSRRSAAEVNPTRSSEFAGLIPGLAQ